MDTRWRQKIDEMETNLDTKWRQHGDEMDTKWTQNGDNMETKWTHKFLHPDRLHPPLALGECTAQPVG